MSYNKLTNEGAKTISKAIKVNTTLHTLHLYQHYTNDPLFFNMTVLTAVYSNSTLMELKLPWEFAIGTCNDDRRLVSSELEKINKERTKQGISTLTCEYSAKTMVIQD